MWCMQALLTSQCGITLSVVPSVVSEECSPSRQLYHSSLDVPLPANDNPDVTSPDSHDNYFRVVCIFSALVCSVRDATGSSSVSSTETGTGTSQGKGDNSFLVQPNPEWKPFIFDIGGNG
ncbi:hypothetical protein ElyMa_001039400 [Elysia marginata]|uniref:Uncharacterized protein n=1 Tax=Elysia marginata TaxID=1093978 RepID=A0AAV4HM86_9GAST|nr:hypothetical protein ElyMa_001039400 [Elysia marginata]